MKYKYRIKEIKEEISQCFFKTMEIILEVKNNRIDNNKTVYDIDSQKFLVKKTGKFYSEELTYTKKLNIIVIQEIEKKIW